MTVFFCEIIPFLKYRIREVCSPVESTDYCGAIFFLIVRNYKVEVNRSAGVFGRGSLRSLLPPHTSPHDKFRPKITARMTLTLKVKLELFSIIDLKVVR